MDRETSTNSLSAQAGIFVFIFCFVFGILISSFIFVPPIFSFLIVFLGATILVTEKVFKGKLEKEVLLLAVVLISFGFGALRYSIKDFHELLIPTSTGIVISEPEQRENTTRFILLTDNGEKLLVNTDLYSPAKYGDMVKTVGKLQEPSIIEGENGGRPFDYGKYLAKDGIYYILNFAEVEVLSSGHGNPLKHILFKIKRGFVRKTKEILTEPYASFLSGLLVSGREAMSKDILEEFRRAGVIHIVVLSGYNITIVAEFMRMVFRNATFSIAGIILFVIMTGAQATVVRAALMVLVVILAKTSRRKFSAPRALLAAAFFMLLQNPKILVFDPSFQLSFLATCGLIFVTPIIERYLPRVSSMKWGLGKILSTTLATQITVLPFLIYSMGDVSLVSLPANMLILIFIPFTMLVGFIATLVAFVNLTIALPFSYITYILLAWILGVAHYLSSLFFASVSVPLVPVWLVVAVYLVIVTLIWRWRNSPQHSANSG
ncbi:MAG: hypothetical protein A3C70_03425 [Candidatus Zambryskibacteria bacterium RIFCSPHIGHO2_02_FULL_43_14]|uniref:ComEC/Rec2-related protein domain-containing protein n=1 Tax=Candidatus Zambryskibacteria bacterium RIFCSPHIGHO2_02_FULL_43_14 TaxID=1802748 RepID=A0A1G2TFS6_9BACT|nr:MAG: hypothetical protein A2829_00870 [Candidatus Zambryskibacteria bacterium RIFCSPHIGHO2_01_FULL_43_60]OHA96137.1 MAG: hypothetical protein A3C70_03425 [Candidatus Zambryskibacteria bacterium RIFCSPHIGHO2_02_FULL_43_14]OHB03137.1 MAG: hypothetical protein A3B03_01710 [Candidatus Zambryskibacteria bacterium RIFCSPLOWO2_01_FULL_42_41]